MSVLSNFTKKKADNFAGKSKVMIAITGANGHLGKATIQFLLQKVAPTDIVAIIRNPETVNEFKEKGVTTKQADYNDFNTLKEVFKGIETVLQISTIGVDIETAKQQEKNVVNAIVENNVKHIVYTSIVQARPNTIFQGTETQYHTEELIKETKIPYTFFRNSMYMEAIPELIGNVFQTNEIRYPSGSGKVSFVSRTDIAEAIANVLTENTHQNQTYEITGNKAYTFGELAKLLSAEMKHIDIADTTFREELIGYQMPVDVVDLLVSMANGIKVGEFSYTSDTLEKLLGRKPLDLNKYVKSL
ncbi:SDR family oxidoreductase [Chryseobacterium carnipullorum]|uniref:SDR family oxidoreductase n=2 Tax=Chryseobacterium group TaxID=2782232 RepID=A0A3G6M731_CHRCU|nr:SDR family oxidoreductase [Chryseobacterium carnipullorum]AZA63891.1 SDR family oxidoreductase [Chryseobacterium carnipullorum]